jgi:ligand-binding SRPBCC domain-containing protein
LNLLLDIIAIALEAKPRPAAGLVVLERETLVRASLEETFAFFAEATNLERLTPGWLNFHIRSAGPLTMREGLEIDYVIVLHGLPIPWKTRIDAWEPGVRFVDRQTHGPYLWWHHEHRFEATADGTRVIDRVEFVPRLRWITSGFVRRDVERIFDFRQEKLKEIFAGGAERPRGQG